MHVAMVWSAYPCVHGTFCLCTLSASAFIEPSLHQLDFFLEIFSWRLVDRQKHYITVAILVKTVTIINSLPPQCMCGYFCCPKSTHQCHLIHLLPECMLSVVNV